VDHQVPAASADGRDRDAGAGPDRRTAHYLLAEFPHLKKQFRGRHLWERGYFCCSSGNVTDDVIAKYIAEQNTNVDEDFKVDG
jgi:putative transposase